MANVIKILDTLIENGRRIMKFRRKGRDDIQTAKTLSPFGFESAPVNDTFGLHIETSTLNQSYCVGYINEEPITEPGESRIYSTNSSGEEQIAFHFKADGTVEMGGDADNAVRFSELKTGFDQLKADFNALVNSYNALVTAYNAHVHPVPFADVIAPSGGSQSLPTPASGSPGVTSAATIDASKIDELKTS